MSAPPLTPMGWLRYDVVRRLLREIDRPERVLEIGAGQGAVGTRLATAACYVGVEPDAASAAVAAQRLAAVSPTAEVVHGTLADLPDDSTFDLVCAFEVVEHIEHDRDAVAQWVARVRPGGTLILSTPAHQHRYGPMDARVGHFRRYAPEQLADLLVAAGLIDIRLVLYGVPLGYLLEAARNTIAGRSDSGRPVEEAAPADHSMATAASGRLFQPRAALGPLTRAGTAPFRLIQRGFPRHGTGIVAMARRPAPPNTPAAAHRRPHPA